MAANSDLFAVFSNASQTTLLDFDGGDPRDRAGFVLAPFGHGPRDVIAIADARFHGVARRHQIPFVVEDLADQQSADGVRV